MTALNKYAALRKLAKALSGKEWVAFVHKASGTYAVGSLGHERGEDIIKWPGLDGQDNAESKAKFIAAANPATVLALLDELEVAEKRIAELRDWNAGLAQESFTYQQKVAELEARTPYGYLRQCDGQIQISIGSERPHDRSGGYATPWFAIYTAAGIGVKGE